LAGLVWFGLASFDNKISVADTASKKVLTRLNEFFNTINGQTVAFSPDGKLLAATDRHALNLWRTDLKPSGLLTARVAVLDRLRSSGYPGQVHASFGRP
jgi:sugar lactone lactonase YvrE